MENKPISVKDALIGLIVAFTAIIQNIANLIKVKSISTILVMVCLLMLVSCLWNPNETVLALFSSVIGSITTYYFTKGEKNEQINNGNEDIK
jgi:uncharacterized membrane protein